MCEENMGKYFLISARRKAAAKRKKLKNLGKSKSTDTEEEDNDGEEDGKILFLHSVLPSGIYVESQT